MLKTIFGRFPRRPRRPRHARHTQNYRKPNRLLHFNISFFF
jgi:hypothetical protein